MVNAIKHGKSADENRNEIQNMPKKSTYSVKHVFAIVVLDTAILHILVRVGRPMRFYLSSHVNKLSYQFICALFAPTCLNELNTMPTKAEDKPHFSDHVKLFRAI